MLTLSPFRDGVKIRAAPREWKSLDWQYLKMFHFKSMGCPMLFWLNNKENKSVLIVVRVIMIYMGKKLKEEKNVKGNFFFGKKNADVELRHLNQLSPDLILNLFLFCFVAQAWLTILLRNNFRSVMEISKVILNYLTL